MKVKSGLVVASCWIIADNNSERCCAQLLITGQHCVKEFRALGKVQYGQLVGAVKIAPFLHLVFTSNQKLKMGGIFTALIRGFFVACRQPEFFVWRRVDESARSPIFAPSRSRLSLRVLLLDSLLPVPSHLPERAQSSAVHERDRSDSRAGAKWSGASRLRRSGSAERQALLEDVASSPR